MMDREEFFTRLRAGAKINCPCCGRYSQIYRRQVHHVMAMQLIKLYQLGGEHSYVHVSHLIPPGAAGVSDITTARYWGLVQKSAAETDDKPAAPTGLLMLTELGVKFVRCEVAVPRYVYVFDDTVLALSPDAADIRKALGNKFKYEDIFEGV